MKLMKEDFNTSADESVTSMTSARTTSRETVTKSTKSHRRKSKPSRGDKKSSRSDKSSKKRATTTSTMEVQVDTHDLLKYSDVLKSVNVYNPSSLILSSLSFFNDSSSLSDLDQLTGFNLINQTFNDLIGMNLSFFKNFLNTQRTLYEQQLQSIQPK